MSQDPLGYSVWQYLLFAGIGALGGLTHRLQHLANDKLLHCWKCAILALVADIATSAFCGVLMFWACESIRLSSTTTAVLVGIAGHMGSRLLFLSENLLVLKIKALTQENTQKGDE